MRAMICLICVAIVGVTTGKLMFPAKSVALTPPQPTVIKAAALRVVDTTPFRVRWEPMQGRPPSIDQTRDVKENTVRTETIKARRDLAMYPPASEPVAEPEVREPTRSPQRRHRNIRYASHGGEKATCIRVNMRTVYRNGGRSWNCRR